MCGNLLCELHNVSLFYSPAAGAALSFQWELFTLTVVLFPTQQQLLSLPLHSSLFMH